MNLRPRRRASVSITTCASAFVIILAGVGVAILASSACKGPKPDRTSVRGAFALYMGISTRGNYGSLYPMLVSQLRDKIAGAHHNIQECVSLISRHYPPVLKSQALQDLGPPGVLEAHNPEEYLAALMDASGRPALDIRERLTSKVKRIREVKPGTFSVTTVSGARVRFVQGGDGRFYLVPTERDIRLIRQQYLLSIERLGATRKTVKTLGSNG